MFLKKYKTNTSKARKISSLAFLIVFLVVIMPHGQAFASGTDTGFVSEAADDLSSEEEPKTDADNEAEGLLSIETPETDEGFDNTDALELSEMISEVEYTDVTISNTITGKYADMTKTFLYTVYFADSANKDYTAGEIIECEDSVLILTDGGKAEFFLAHEQKITLKELPADTSIQIVQTAANGYRVSFKDSENENIVHENDTAPLAVGENIRSFDFENNRTEITPVGISGGTESFQAAVLLSLSVLLTVVAVVDFIKRKKCKI